MLGYLFADIISPEKPTEEDCVSFKEQIMSKGKYTNIFSRQMECATRALLKIGEYLSLGYFPVLAGE